MVFRCCPFYIPGFFDYLLARSGDARGTFWDAVCGRSGALWDALRTLWGPSGSLWGFSGDALGTLWDALGRSGDTLGRSGTLGVVPGRSGKFWGRSGNTLGFWVALGTLENGLG